MQECSSLCAFRLRLRPRFRLRLHFCLKTLSGAVFGLNSGRTPSLGQGRKKMRSRSARSWGSALAGVWAVSSLGVLLFAGDDGIFSKDNRHVLLQAQGILAGSSRRATRLFTRATRLFAQLIVLASGVAVACMWFLSDANSHAHVGKFATAIAGLERTDAHSRGRLQQLDTETKEDTNW